MQFLFHIIYYPIGYYIDATVYCNGRKIQTFTDQSPSNVAVHQQCNAIVATLAIIAELTSEGKVSLKNCSVLNTFVAAVKKTGIPEPFAVFPTNVCLPRQILMGSYFLGCLSAQQLSNRDTGVDYKK